MGKDDCDGTSRDWWCHFGGIIQRKYMVHSWSRFKNICRLILLIPHSSSETYYSLHILLKSWCHVWLRVQMSLRFNRICIPTPGDLISSCISFHIYIMGKEYHVWHRAGWRVEWNITGQLPGSSNVSWMAGSDSPSDTGSSYVHKNCVLHHGKEPHPSTLFQCVPWTRAW